MNLTIAHLKTFFSTKAWLYLVSISTMLAGTGQNNPGQAPPQGQIDIGTIAGALLPSHGRALAQRASQCVSQTIQGPSLMQPENDDQCAICQEVKIIYSQDPQGRTIFTATSEDGTNVTGNMVKLPCNHVFCKSCMNPWLPQNSCPTCRAPIIDNQPQNAASQPDFVRLDREILMPRPYFRYRIDRDHDSLGNLSFLLATFSAGAGIGVADFLAKNAEFFLSKKLIASLPKLPFSWLLDYLSGKKTIDDFRDIIIYGALSGSPTIFLYWITTKYDHAIRRFSGLSSDQAIFNAFVIAFCGWFCGDYLVNTVAKWQKKALVKEADCLLEDAEICISKKAGHLT